MGTTSVYVEPVALEGWKAQMQSINSECVSNLERIGSIIGSLNSSLDGTAANSFVNSINKFMTTAKDNHQKMSSVESFLDTVVEVMNNH